MTDKSSNAAIALINAVANFAGLGLPPLIGLIKDTNNTYDLALVLIASALVGGGILGSFIAKRNSTPSAPVSHGYGQMSGRSISTDAA